MGGRASIASKRRPGPGAGRPARGTQAGREMNGCLGPLGKRCWRGGICRKGIKWCETAGGRRGEWGQGFSCKLGALPSAREPGLGTISTGARRCPRGRGHGVRAGPDFSWAGRGGCGHSEVLWLPPRGAGGSWRGPQRGLRLPGTRPASTGPTHRGPGCGARCFRRPPAPPRGTVSGWSPGASAAGPPWPPGGPGGGRGAT